jgi:hypothetical protein
MPLYNDNHKCKNGKTRLGMIYIWIISSPDLRENLHTTKIHWCGPVRYISKQEYCKIFTERNSDWNGVTLGQEWGVIWLKCMNENSRARCHITYLETAINYHVLHSFAVWNSFFFITYATSQRGWVFPNKNQSHKLMDIFSETGD